VIKQAPDLNDWETFRSAMESINEVWPDGKIDPGTGKRKGEFMMDRLSSAHPQLALAVRGSQSANPTYWDVNITRFLEFVDRNWVLQ
jgi:hypothetical protein